MTVTRELHELPKYAYCADPGCPWTDTGTGYPHSEAETHCLLFGHEVRIYAGRESIVRPDGIGWGAE